MRDERSASQILYGFLPRQTGDLQGRVWRVVEWDDARGIDVDARLVHERLLYELNGWGPSAHEAANRLRRGAAVEVVQVNPRRGVRVERFPEVWVCRACRRVDRDPTQTCVCDGRAWEQLHFVGYHTCGYMDAPSIPRCPEHAQVRIVQPRTQDARQIVFDCPTCKKRVQKGLGWRKCPCGSGVLNWNVHRAGSVYSPQQFTMINPANTDELATFASDTGRQRSLHWALGGFVEQVPPAKVTSVALVDGLIRQGFDRSFAEQMARLAAEQGQLGQDDHLGDLANAPTHRIETAAREAGDAAIATSSFRRRLADVAATNGDGVGHRYEQRTSEQAMRSGVEPVEFIDRFPVLKAVYGFTRGGFTPGEVNLNMFQAEHANGYRIHAELQETEALFVRLDPLRLHTWLASRGHRLPPANDARSARIAIAAASDVPNRFDDEETAQSLGRDLLQLTHSYSHRFIRHTAVLAGIDRESLGEYLLPIHGAFFIYAASRGDFVLGGLQALFENDLDLALSHVVDAESRCPLDPGCDRQGAACSGCLHLGEPSCAYFNHFLDRRTLFGEVGYLAMRQPTAGPNVDGQVFDASFQSSGVVLGQGVT